MPPGRIYPPIPATETECRTRLGQFGSAYEEVIRIKKWIVNHAKAAEISAFLHAARNAKTSMI